MQAVWVGSTPSGPTFLYIQDHQSNSSLPPRLPALLLPYPQLPRPTTHGRAAAKTHLPTDEHALNQLRQHSPLPSLVLQYRALQVLPGRARPLAPRPSAWCPLTVSAGSRDFTWFMFMPSNLAWFIVGPCWLHNLDT